MGDEVMVLDNDKLRLEKVINISDLIMQGNCTFFSYFLIFCMFTLIYLYSETKKYRYYNKFSFSNTFYLWD